MTSTLDDRARRRARRRCARPGPTSASTRSARRRGRVVEMEGRGEVLVLSSNNYLGLADQPEVVEAGIEGLRRYGAGTASRALHLRHVRAAPRARARARRPRRHRGGAHLRLVLERERGGDPDARPTTNTVILSDELNHASIIDAMRLAKPGAQGGLQALRHGRAARRSSSRCEPGQRKLVITDGVFSMEGDLAKLPEHRRARARARRGRRSSTTRTAPASSARPAAASPSTSACSARST